MIDRRSVAVLALVVFLLASPAPAPAEASWQAGVAKVNITPPTFMPMAGYASRGAKHAEEKLTDLWAKALALQDADGHRAVLITVDLIGVDRALSLSVCKALKQRFGLARDQVALCFSHTHTGPVVAKNLRPMHYMLLDEANRRLVDDYARHLEQQVVAVVGEALKKLAPARLAWGSGRAAFAVNRRNNPAAEVPKLRAEGKLQGPQDHDVPVLAVRQAGGELQAVVFGYACHATTLSSLQWSGDYPGFAQIEVEQAHPGCIALFWAGCGGDQNPLPRRTVALARQYGKELAAAVGSTVAGEMRAVDGALKTSYREIDLALAELPSREQLEKDVPSKNRYIAARAEHLLKRIDAGKPLTATYPFPIGVWRLGDEVRFVFLGGEVVVDYALRLKAELGSQAVNRGDVWVAGYANDVMAYIPSLRVLQEGGYEGGGAMVYYGLPAAWAPEVETDIVRAVHQLTESGKD